VYVLGTPEVPSGPVRIFLDVESNPEEGFVYLIGMIVLDGDSETRHSFWADCKGQECDIFEQFVSVVSRHDDVHIYCYGAAQSVPRTTLQ